ncbi:unnamed protein product [Oncorhynchus mykiss]|uniref:RasGAP protein C-terminal domain-containing protein n=1 Tax=Oncorhynchus mykiss TaxID=8022 RepID=A0A060WSE0_ONCMY|nr:unnamed protein product [Oncorhynchus mykiss]
MWECDHTGRWLYTATVLSSLSLSLSFFLPHGKKAAESKGKKSKHPTLTYTVTRLHEKGFLVEIENLPVTQFKNVIFDIVPGDEGGTFQARFMGVDMEKFPLKYQVRPAPVRGSGGDEDVRQGQSQRQPANLPSQQEVLQEVRGLG